MSSEIIEALDSAGNGVRVIFEWRDDRFHHAIYGMQLGEPIPLVQSVEGDAVSPWPPSPPLQQLHKQQQESGDEILLLTGMAGSSHWSGSVLTAVDQKGPEVTFDFACRHRMQPEWLGGTYRLASGVEAEMVGKGVILNVEKAIKWRVCRAESDSASLKMLAGNSLTIEARENAQLTAASTSRWMYLIQIATSQYGN